ncbi:MAG: LysR family transcriptional regulator, partial [Rhodospirillales bacterium]
MDLRHLRYFVALAEERHFGRAAARLQISQPPLTRQIRQLEEYLGLQLVIRTPKGADLTSAGETFYTEARHLLRTADTVVERTRQASRGEIGRLDVGAFGSPLLKFVPSLVS